MHPFNSFDPHFAAKSDSIFLCKMRPLSDHQKASVPAAVRCPKCRAALAADVSEGLCPVCAFLGALELEPGAVRPLVPEHQLPRQFGEYELLEEIARGGMGIVYKARQTNLNRLVAVKVLLSGPLASSADLQRFQAEAEAVANLQHPNIVAIHEVGEHAGQPFFSMDYVEGPCLSELIREHPLPAARAAGYVKTIAEAIQYAHERGVLHRDLKPSNVLIDHAGQPRIIDFGLAKRLSSDPQLSTIDDQLTLTGQVLGSPNFIPPEQAAGKRGAIGCHSDIYSLGAILYHLLTARPPFVAATAHEIVHQVLNTEPVGPRSLNPSVPRDLETICLKCLQKEPHRRYRTAQELADELSRFLRVEPIQARPVGPLGRFWRGCRRNPKLAVLAATVVLLGLTMALVSFVFAIGIAAAHPEYRLH
jgi:eukaryotic-like serine/threonine-protein kinase